VTRRARALSLLPVPLLLGVVWGAAAVRLGAQAAARHEAAVLEAVAAARAVLEAAHAEAGRAARMVAQDPAIVEGARRGASPRLLALTLERAADLLLVLDARGAPLVQVPAAPPGAAPAWAGSTIAQSRPARPSPARTSGRRWSKFETTPRTRPRRVSSSSAASAPSRAHHAPGRA